MESLSPRLQQAALSHARRLRATLARPGSADPRTNAAVAGALHLLAETGDHAGAARLMRDALAATGDPDLLPHLSRLEFLAARAADPAAKEEAATMKATLAAMDAEIRRHALYVPGDFWATYGAFNVKLLEDYGLGNFKRTVSHNYQNWLMTSRADPQVRRLFDLWSRHGSLEPWRNTIEAPDHVGNPNDPTFGTVEYPLASAEKREVYRLAVGLLWEYVLCTDPFGALEGLTEHDIGNPVHIRRRGQLISSDLAHSVRERSLLLGALGLTGREGLSVGELGGGHGRLAEIFGRTTNYRYFIFDITPALYVSQWYVKQIFPEARIFEFRHFDHYADIESELGECRFAFFTANQIELMPHDAFDLFINMNSLMEMRADQIRNFLGHIDRLTTRAFLSRQWLEWRNSADSLTVSKADFSLGPRWRLALDQIDDIHPGFFNQVWRRT